MARDPFIIVGAGLAGARAAQALRAGGHDGPVTLIGAEEELPYERPPLSKGYLTGKTPRAEIYVHPAQWYADQRIDLRLGTRVTGIDRAARRAILADGSQLPYSRLLLATGASPRPLPVPGADLDGVLYLRTAADSDALKAALAPAPAVVVLGGGWIGLEVAAAARAAGAQVSVVETAELPLAGVLGPQMARVFAGLHRDHGVALHTGIGASKITGTGSHADGVRLTDGTHLEAGVIIAGVGARPGTRLAEGAGLETDNGVVTGPGLRTSDPDIYAAGDVARAFHPLAGRPVRVEHWANAEHQGEAAGAAMAGQQVSYDRVPYFYSDQFDLGMEYTGYAEPGSCEQVVVRGDLAGREFIAFWLDRDDRVLAGMNVNVWDVADAIAALVRSGRPVSPDALRDSSADLAALAA